MRKFFFLLTIFLLCGCNTSKHVSYNNNVIFIDPGHGGKDNGTSYGDIFEDELNMKLSSILYNSILEDGNVCYISRIADYDLSYSYSKNHKIADLNQRIKYIDNSMCDVFVSLHLNYYYQSNVNGLQVFYKKNDSNSFEFATLMQTKLNELNRRNKVCKPGDYYILNNTKCNGILVEYGFLSNDNDRQKLLNDSYLAKLSKVIKEGIYDYLKVK